MLKLDLHRAFADKGIENPNRFLRQCGITSYTASRLLTNSVNSISFKHLELICLGLNCTIDDLFLWKPDKHTAELKNHPLQKLTQRERQGNIGQKLKQLPFDKLEQVRNYLDQLNKE